LSGGASNGDGMVDAMERHEDYLYFYQLGNVKAIVPQERKPERKSKRSMHKSLALVFAHLYLGDGESVQIRTLRYSWFELERPAPRRKLPITL
jgi:hypothetical protein